MRIRARWLIFAAAAAVVAACDEAPKSPMVGKPAPDVRLTPAIPGSDIMLSGYKGKVLVLDFWATWCGPCRELMPILGKLQDKYRERGLIVMGISGEGSDVVRGFRRDNPELGYDLFIDHADTAMTEYGAATLPTTVVVDREGKIVFWDTGLGPRTGQELDQAIQKALGEA